LSNSKRGIAVDENGKLDDEISVISSEVCLDQRLDHPYVVLMWEQQNRKYYNDRFGFKSRRIASEGWHAE
jgi:hypothetical protein